MPEDTLYAVIMAGGSGTRLWPRSRARQPKPFLDLLGPDTMLQQAKARLQPIVPPERTLVVTNGEYVPIVREQLPDLPAENVLAEPSARGTAPAIGLAAAHLNRRDPAALMAVLTADHLIARQDVFRDALRAAASVASDGWLVTLGIHPTYPETGYGYIERGAKLRSSDSFPAYEVARFVEKPPRERAEEYVAAGTYSWNSGMFVWQVSQILREMSVYLPDLYRGLREIQSSLGTPDAGATLERVWDDLGRETTIDYGIMEQSHRVAVLPVDIGWTDVGSWATVFDLSPKDEAGNVVVGRHLTLDTVRSLLYSPDRLVVTVGLEDMIVVDTGDVLLLCPRSRAQEIKRLVTMLKDRGLTGYL